MHRFVIRPALASDIDSLLVLSRYLDSANLPHHRGNLEIILQHSEMSFKGEIENPLAREYVFAMIDHEHDRVIGTCQVIARHGSPSNPHVFFELGRKEHHSPTLKKQIEHEVLSLRWNDDGPTEVGGIVVDPEYQHAPEKLGKQLSYMRFMFIAAHRNLFQSSVIAEMMPALTEKGESPFWNALGKHFTELEYHEACHLSRFKRQFVIDLFPHQPIYTSLIGESARQAIGTVGSHSVHAEQMLKSMGFEYHQRVDAFDAGRHIEANTDQISLVRRTKALHIANINDEIDKNDSNALIMRIQNPFASHFQLRAVAAPFELSEGMLSVSSKTLERLGASPQEEVFVLSL